MATPTFVWDSSVTKSILCVYDSASGLPKFQDDTGALFSTDITDRAARLLGVVYGSQGQKIQQKAATYETLIDVASQSLTALKVSATAAANLVTNPIFVQPTNGTAVADINAANTARTTGTIVQAVQGIDAAGVVLSTSALALDSSVNTLLKPASTLAGVTTVATVTNLAQQGGVAISLNTGVRDTGTQRVTIATNDLVPISAASLPLPSGASTEATLALIKAKTDNIPAQGQGLMAASTPVVVASNQTTIPTLDTNSAAILAAVQAAKAVALIQNWTAVAQNTVVKSATYDMSGKHKGILHVQAALDTVTAHTGTRMIVQISSNTSGDQDWQNLTEFITLNGTAVTQSIGDNPLGAGSTTITLTATTYTVLGKLLFIKDGTLANSELVLQTAQAVNSITILDGTANAHALNTAMYNIAMTQDITIPEGVNRIRLVVDNSYSPSGSSLNYKVRVSTVV